MLAADITEADLMHRFAEFPPKVLPHPPSPEVEQRPSTADQRPKIKTVELADTPQQTLVTERPEPPSAITNYEVTKRRSSSDSAAVETSDSDDAK